MKLQYDPLDGEKFWQSIEGLPGYPRGEHMPIPQMLFESGAVFRLPEVLARSGASPALPVLVVMDATPMRRGYDSLKPLIVRVLGEAGWQPVEMVMEPDATGQVHTDMPHIEAVKARLQPGMAVLAVGAGTICDIAKHACHLYAHETGNKLPFVVYQTANSVCAFTSNMAPTFADGVKRTLASRYPDALVCDLETLRDAPHAMTAAGVGDLLAAFTSLPDWYLAHRLGMDPSYNRLAQALLGPLDEIFLEQAPAILKGDLEAISMLTRLISLGGLAMSLSHATTPLSGYEHVISHILDLKAELSNRPLAIHGAQASLSTVLAAGTYRHFLDEFEPAEVLVERCYPDAENMAGLVRSRFASIDPTGKAGEECWADYRLKLEAWHAHRADFEACLADWPAIRRELEASARPPERVLQILRAVDAPVTFAQLDPPASQADAKYAFMTAPLMRKRLTLGDLLIFLGWDREALWRQVWWE